MSIYKEAFADCVFLNKSVIDDGYGGTTTAWTEGAHFRAAVALDRSDAVKIAAVLGEVSKYKVTTSKALTLEYHDVFRRTADGKIFRVTSDGDDNHTPPSAGLDMRQVDAEEWKLPN